MPLAEQQIGDGVGRQEDGHAGEGEQEERGEEAGNVEPELGFQQAEGEARSGAGRSGRELGDHGRDEGEAAGDLQAGQEVGQGVGDLQVDQCLPAAGAVELEQVQQVVVRRFQALHGVRQDRKEGDDPCADEESRLRGRRVDEDQRGDRDDRGDLEHHRVGVEREFGKARLRHQHGERDAAGKCDGKRGERDLERDDEGGRQDRPVRVERPGDAQRARQDVVRHIECPDVDRPCCDQQNQHHQGNGYPRDPRKYLLGFE